MQLDLSVVHPLFLLKSLGKIEAARRSPPCIRVLLRRV